MKRLSFALLIWIMAFSAQAASLPDWALEANDAEYYIINGKSAAGWSSSEQVRIDFEGGYAVVGEYNPLQNYGATFKTVKINPQEYQVEIKMRSVDAQWFFGAYGNLERANLVQGREDVGVYRFDLPKLSDNGVVTFFLGTSAPASPQAEQKAKVEYIKLIEKPQWRLSDIMTSVVVLTTLLFK